MIDFILKYWLECLFSGVLAVIGAGLKYIFGKIKKEQEKQRTVYEKEREEQQYIKNGVLALLHDRLYQYAEYLLTKEKLSTDEVDNLNYIYSSYAALGGNGTGEILYNACRKRFENQGLKWIDTEELNAQKDKNGIQ